MLTSFMLFVLALFIGFIAAEVFVLIRWKGAWRLTALLPLFTVGFIVVRIVVDVRAHPTSHNLWAFEVLIWSFLAFLFLGTLVGIRWIIKITQGHSG